MKPIMEAITAVEADTPRLSQLLPLWEQLLQHSIAWAGSIDTPDCLKVGVVESFQRRFNKHEHDSWYAAQGLDPTFAVKDAEGDWRLQLHTMEQDKRDRVVTLVARLAGTSEDVVDRELMIMELQGLPASMTRALEHLTERGEGTEKMQPARQRRGWWRLGDALAMFPSFSEAAIRLLSAHVTTAAAERNWSAWGRLYQGGQRSRMAIETAAALIYVKGNSTTQQRDDYEICLDIQE